MLPTFCSVLTASIEAFNFMATSITDNIRSSAKSISVRGKAFRTEMFIEVRWPWVIRPITVVVLSTVLLAATATASRKQQAILWKASVIPLLMSRVQTVPEHDMTFLRHADEVKIC